MRECEEKLRSVHSVRTHNWISRVARSWQAAKRGTRVKHADELKSHASYCTIGQKSQAGQVISLRLEVATQSSCEAKSPDHSVWEKLAFRIPNTHQYKYPLYPRIIKSFQREFWEKPLEKNKIDSSTIFILWFSKFLDSHHLHWYILERYISQNLFSLYPYLWGRYLVPGK